MPNKRLQPTYGRELECARSGIAVGKLGGSVTALRRCVLHGPQPLVPSHRGFVPAHLHDMRLHRTVRGSRGGFVRRAASFIVAPEGPGRIVLCSSTLRCCSLGQLRAASSSLASPSVAAQQFVRADAGEHCAFTSRRRRRGSTQALCRLSDGRGNNHDLSAGGPEGAEAPGGKWLSPLATALA